MKAKDIIIAGAVFAGLYFLLGQRRNPYATDPRYTPPPVDPRQLRSQQQIAALQQWILAMVALFGNVRAHWQPGGMFYNIPKNIMDDINIAPPAPGEGDGSGWA